MKLFISPPESTPWSIDLGVFERALLRAFAPVEVEHPPPGSAHALRWRWDSPFGRAEGTLDHARNCIVLDGDIRAGAHVAMWARALTPGTQRLVAYDESYAGLVELTAATTENEICARMMSP